MIKKLTTLITLAIALAACSAPVDDIEAFGAEEELGQVELAFNGKVTDNFQMGTQTGSSRQRCNRTSSGQVCVIPKAKSLKYCIDRHFADPQDPIFSDAEYQRVKNIVTGSNFSGWTFTEINSFNCLNGLSGTPDIIFFIGSVGSSGTGSSNVKDYGTNVWSCVNGTTGCLNNLTEGTGVVGQYQSWTNCKAIIDRTDIYAKGTSATQDNNGFDHAAAHTWLACLGLGGRSGDGGRATRNLFNPSTTAVAVSTAEACTLNNFNTSNAGQYNHLLTPCSGD